MIDPDELTRCGRPRRMPFRIGKIGHVVLNVCAMARSVRFYTEVLGFEVSDIYPEAMVPGGMAFSRCNPIITALRWSAADRVRRKTST
jgi:catechol 2,3-dioxygenase-like lactoylglutathione lyase family enzyme